jgi:FAD/FMN-containing dehydrogenase
LTDALGADPTLLGLGASRCLFVVHEGLGVGVMATPHGFVSPRDGGVLINTSRMKGVRVDPEAQTARVEPGALWTDVIPEAQVLGLAGLVGSSSMVGVVGYTMGGGFGWLGRKYGDLTPNLAEKLKCCYP